MKFKDIKPGDIILTIAFGSPDWGRKPHEVIEVYQENDSVSPIPQVRILHEDGKGIWLYPEEFVPYNQIAHWWLNA